MASVEQNKKKEDLENYLKELGSVAVAFFGGVDSTFLLKVAHDTLGEKCIAVTAKSCSFPEREFDIIQRIAVISAKKNSSKKYGK